uniref:Type-2 ice-structuring protein-like n=1 Tax=Acanthochromis polyacanthus TaxID=80966 RepID=A0A3Q1EF18_9TELE
MKMLTVCLLLTAMLVQTQTTPLPDTMLPPLITEDLSSGHHFYDDWHLTCPDGWTSFYHRCLRYVPTKMTWAEAARNCETLGGSLAIVAEYLHGDDIREVMWHSGHTRGKVWIGEHHSPEHYSSWGDYFGWLPDYYHGHHQRDCHQKTFGEEDPDAKLPSVCSK